MLELISEYFVSLFPAGFDPNAMFWSMLTIFGVVALAAVVIRFVFKTASAYLHALSSAMAILFFYLFCILLYQSFPGFFRGVLELLPLIELTGDSVTLYTFNLTWENLSVFCGDFLHILIFSLILITLDDMIPDAKNTVSWIVLQFFIVVLTCVLYRAVLEVLELVPQNILQEYAPVILVFILFTFVVMGLLKIIFTIMLVTVSPLLGAVGAWFSGSKSGQILGKSVLCALLICFVFSYAQMNGMDALVFAEMTPIVYLLYMVMLLVLWVLTGHFL